MKPGSRIPNRLYNCNLNHIKINSGLSEDGSDKYMFNPDEYFSDYIERRSRNLRLDDNFSKCIDNIKKGINSSFSKNNTENNNVFFKNSNLIGASLGGYYSRDRCKDCAIDTNTNYSINGLTARKYTYMDLDGAISKEQIPDFLKM